MGLRHNPITYLVLSNGLLWGLPLAINHWQASRPSLDAQALAVASRKPSNLNQAAANAALITTADPLLAADPLLTADPLLGPGALLGPTSNSGGSGGLSGGVSGQQASMAGSALAGSALASSGSDGAATAQLPFRFNDLPIRPASSDLLSQLSGADGLGGPLTLASLNEPAMPIAARAEQLRWQRSNDALAAIPLHWRDPLRKELGNRVQVSQAATVRLPVRDLAERQEVPVIITDQGVAEGLVTPKNPRTREAVETWAARQQPAQPGTVQVMVVAAEPVEAPAAEASNVVASLPAPAQRSLPAGPPPLPPIPESPL